jgi:undecaprenyl-diphosphatase
MTMIQAMILGVVQGLTELLPVSSSAHLVFAQSCMPGFHQPGILFDAVLHLGTLVSVGYFFRKDLVAIFSSVLPGFPMRTVPEEQQKAYQRLFLLILISTFITGVLGLLFQERIELLFSSIKVAAAMLFVTGLLLFVSDWKKHADKSEAAMSYPGAILIGIVQAIALIPGISRSGSTIAGGIFLGLSREAAARYSFLISIPAILGAVVLQSLHFTAIETQQFFPYLLGFMTAVITGLLSLKILYLFIRKANLRFFAYYCWLAGGAVLISSLGYECFRL